MEFGVEKPGDLIIVDHSIFRAFNKGALGMMHVNGRGQPEGLRRGEGTRPEGRVMMRRGNLAVVVTLSVFSLVANAGSAPALATKSASGRARMAWIPAGHYHPLYADGAPPIACGRSASTALR